MPCKSCSCLTAEECKCRLHSNKIVYCFVTRVNMCDFTLTCSGDDIQTRVSILFVEIIYQNAFVHLRVQSSDVMFPWKHIIKSNNVRSPWINVICRQCKQSVPGENIAIMLPDTFLINSFVLPFHIVLNNNWWKITSFAVPSVSCEVTKLQLYATISCIQLKDTVPFFQAKCVWQHKMHRLIIRDKESLLFLCFCAVFEHVVITLPVSEGLHCYLKGVSTINTHVGLIWDTV